MQRREWLPNPADGSDVCGGFDGSENNDWTVIKLETVDGLLFTPRLSGDRPSIWNPAASGGRIPRLEVHDAWDEINERWRISRVYCDPGFSDEFDPTSWKTEIEQWAAKFGTEKFLSWQMSGSTRIKPVHAMLRRFETDLETGALRHDGCPVTKNHALNARKINRSGDRYILGKPTPTQKIDAVVTSALCHEAACDARAAGWSVHRETYIYM